MILMADETWRATAVTLVSARSFLFHPRTATCFLLLMQQMDDTYFRCQVCSVLLVVLVRVAVVHLAA